MPNTRNILELMEARYRQQRLLLGIWLLFQSVMGRQCSTNARLLDKTLGLEGNKRLRLVNDQEDNAFFMVDNYDEEYMEDDNEMQENAPDTSDKDSIGTEDQSHDIAAYSTTVQ